MFGPTGSVSISLGSIVLDRPDQSGLYVAKDLVGSWAYLVTDHEGDSRLRGHGACAGGLEVALRCAFLSAGSRVPLATQVRIVVEDAQAHRTMVRLASADLRVMAAIAGRPVAVMTRPGERASFQVRSAAERAAAAALLDRERDEQREDAPADMPPPDVAPPDAAPADVAPADGATDTAVGATASAAASWRLRRGVAAVRRPSTEPQARVRAAPPAASPPVASPPVAGPFAGVRRLLRPLVDAARDGLAAAGILGARRAAPRSRAVSDWLSEFESRVATVRADLRDMGT